MVTEHKSLFPSFYIQQIEMEVVFGGTGDRNEDGVLESGQFFGAFSNPQVTSEVDARAFL